MVPQASVLKRGQVGEGFWNSEMAYYTHTKLSTLRVAAKFMNIEGFGAKRMVAFFAFFTSASKLTELNLAFGFHVKRETCFSELCCFIW